MFESLSEKLEGALKDISGQGRINELNIASTMREIRRALLDADVNYQVAREFTDRVKERALGEKVLSSISPGQQLVKLVYDELVYFLGGEKVGIEIASKPPTVILVAGLQGSGKTTFCGKLARHLKSQGRSPLLAAADVYRPAAVDQLKTVASSIKVPVFSIEENGVPVKDAVRVARGVALGLQLLVDLRAEPVHQHDLHAHAADQRQVLRDVLQLARRDRLAGHPDHEGLAPVHVDVGRHRAEPGHEGEIEDGGHATVRTDSGEEGEASGTV